MYLVGLDTETELIERGNSAPRLACLTIARENKPTQIFGRKSALDIFRSYVTDPEAVLVGHNGFYDYGVLGSEDESLELPIFEAFRAGRVRDTLVRQTLLQIRAGDAVDGKTSHLDELARQYLGVDLNKGEDSWRYWYGELMDTPLEQWPDDARAYATSDASTTLQVFLEQQKVVNLPEWKISPDETLQTRAAWVLHLMRMWGFRTDAEMVAALRANLEREVAGTETHLIELGFKKVDSTRKIFNDLRGRRLLEELKLPRLREEFAAAGKTLELSKDTAAIKAAVKAAYERRGMSPPMTGGRVSKETGERVPEIAYSKEALEGAEDPDLQALADAAPNEKLLSTFVPLVEAGTRWPITPRWNVLVRSGRTSCGAEDDPGNWQNPKKKGGIRECVIARPGNVLISVDYSQVELCTLSQVIVSRYGSSKMADTINAGRDLHLDLACSFDFLLAPMSYEEATKNKKDKRVKEKRHICKAMNFGFPGGLGWETFITYARTAWGIKGMTEVMARTAKAAWLEKWPEVTHYFRDIAKETEAHLPAVQLFTGRVRGNPDYCSRANSYFQGLAADGAKSALWNVAWNCYVNPKSALYGWRIVLFIHDEIIIEGPEDRATEAGAELARIMIASMRKFTPDVQIQAEPAAMRRWYKDAETVYVNGRLVPWEPAKEAA